MSHPTKRGAATIAALTLFCAGSALADVEVLVPGGSRTVLVTGGGSLPGLPVIREAFDQIFWQPDAPEAITGYLFVNNELATPDGGITRFRYEDGAVVAGDDWVTGTHRNCSGNWSSWGTILSCEEFPQENPDVGHVLEVDPNVQEGWVRRTALGRFSHESIIEDPLTGDFYLTDDSNTGVFFKFVPDTPGDLSAGDLFAYEESTQGWILITDLQNTEQTALQLGATAYPRPEDLAYNPLDDKIYIAITGRSSPPIEPLGNIRRFDPRTNTMSMWLEGDGTLMANPDNLEVDSYGNLLVHEDQYPAHLTAYGPNEVLLVDLAGAVRPVLRGIGTSGEPAGLTFSATENLFWVDWLRSSFSQLIEVSMPDGWNVPATGVNPPRLTPALAPLQAVPNPFDARVRLVRVGAGPADGLSALRIYDVAGRQVQMLEGRGVWHWDGSAADGVALPRGVYWARAGSGPALAVFLNR